MICMLYMKSMPYNAKKIKQKMPAGSYTFAPINRGSVFRPQ